MADIATIAEIGTAAGTLFLGVATFTATRSANRSARVAERALLLGQRPLLASTRREDPDQEVLYGDGRTVRLEAGSALVEAADGVVYMAIPLRNVGAGIAVLDGYDLLTTDPLEEARLRRAERRGLHDRSGRTHQPVERFRPQQRDLYIAPGDTGFWQGALRESREEDEPLRGEVEAAIRGTPAGISVDLLYGDYEGSQHAITRFNLLPGENGGWLSSVAFHWQLDAADPRAG